MDSSPVSPFSRRPDGSQPPLVLAAEEGSHAAAAGSAQVGIHQPPSALRKPTPASDTAREIVASRRSSDKATPDENLMVALQAKLQSKYGIRPDDPIFALIEILKAHEAESRKIASRNDESARKVIEALGHTLAQVREALLDASNMGESVQELNATLIEANVTMGTLQEYMVRVEKLSEHLTQTGYADRVLKILTPAIAALGGVIVGGLIAVTLLALWHK
jgi:hypothetical protein